MVVWEESLESTTKILTVSRIIYFFKRLEILVYIFTLFIGALVCIWTFKVPYTIHSIIVVYSQSSFAEILFFVEIACEL
jgi:hypothetical protein